MYEHHQPHKEGPYWKGTKVPKAQVEVEQRKNYAGRNWRNKNLCHGNKYITKRNANRSKSGKDGFADMNPSIWDI